MENNKIIINSIKNPYFLKEDNFLDYLNNNNNQLINEEFIKPKLDNLDKYFNTNDENNGISNYTNKINLQDNHSFNNFNNFSEKAKIINGGKEKNCMGKNKNGKGISLNENLEEANGMKRQLFNTISKKKFDIEDLKEKKLIMNRESAKKSRLKKKRYIENLEKEFILLKEELIKAKSSQFLCNSDKMKIVNNYEEYYSNKLLDSINKNQNTNINLNCNNKEIELFNLKREEINIISNNLEKNHDYVNDYVNKQRNVLNYLLVKQINAMTPFKIKTFQNKFLKLQNIEFNDNIDVIKNKININLNTIIELYDIDTNISDDNIFNKKNSMAYQLYDFYNNLKAFVNQYDFIYNKL